MDLSVEWVFQAPTVFGPDAFLPFLIHSAPGDIGAAALTDDGRLIVLCNYEAGDDVHCHAYLLDLETGRIIRKITGPPGTRGDWYLNGKTIYVYGREQLPLWRMPWTLDLSTGQNGREELPPWIGCWSLDLSTGRKVGGIKQPQGKRCFQLGREPRDQPWIKPRQEEQGGSPPKRKTYHQLGGGRELVFTWWLQWWISDELGLRATIMELVCTDAAGRKQVRRLGRLRQVAPSECYVLINDQRRLLFCSGSHVVCVDMRKFPPPLAGAQTQPATPTRGREPEDAADSVKEF